jgi:hypothetical protein
MKHKANGTAHVSQVVSLDSQIVAYLKKTGSVDVGKLYQTLGMKDPTLTREKLVDSLSHLAEEGKAELEDIPPVAKSIGEYLGFWERNLGLYLAVAASLFTVLVIYSVPTESMLVPLRWSLGSVFVLFIPGYVTVEALFPKAKELDGIERFALSIGLSLALVPLIGLLLNYTPWGIRLDPIVVSLTMFSLAIAGVGLMRKFRMSFERYELQGPTQLDA